MVTGKNRTMVISKNAKNKSYRFGNHDISMSLRVCVFLMLLFHIIFSGFSCCHLSVCFLKNENETKMAMS